MGKTPRLRKMWVHGNRYVSFRKGDAKSVANALSERYNSIARARVKKVSENSFTIMVTDLGRVLGYFGGRDDKYFVSKSQWISALQDEHKETGFAPILIEVDVVGGEPVFTLHYIKTKRFVRPHFVGKVKVVK